MSNVFRFPEPKAWVLWSVSGTRRFSTLQEAQDAAQDAPVAHIGWLVGGRFGEVAYNRDLGSDAWIPTTILSRDEMLDFLDLQKDAA